jgi:hypothetical protein
VQHHGPWSGRTAKVHVRSHMSVTAGQPLVDLVKAGPLKLRLNAPSRWLGQLKTGLAFEVAIEETGKRYPAKVSGQQPGGFGQPDRRTRSHPGRQLPGTTSRHERHGRLPSPLTRGCTRYAAALLNQPALETLLTWRAAPGRPPA